MKRQLSALCNMIVVFNAHTLQQTRTVGNCCGEQWFQCHEDFPNSFYCFYHLIIDKEFQVQFPPHGFD